MVEDIRWVMALVTIAMIRKDKAAASLRFERRKLQAGRFYPAGAPGMGVDRLPGLLNRRAGDIDKAIVHFDAAFAFNRKAAFLPERKSKRLG
jgi:hypothetical protein